MKKQLFNFKFLLIFPVILGLSYIINLMEIPIQWTTVIYLIGIIVLTMSFKISLEVLISDYKRYKSLINLIIIIVYGIILLVSWISIKLQN